MAQGCMTGMQFAVNIADLTRDKLLGELLLTPVVPNRTVVKAERGRVDGGAVLLETDEQRARSIIAVIRIKWPKHLIRCYESKTGKAWKRI